MDAGVGEAAAAEGAKTAGEAAASYGTAAEAADIGTALTGATGAVGTSAALSAGVPFAAGASAGASVLSKVTAGASLVNAGAGLVNAMSAKGAMGRVAAPGVTPRPVMPSPDDEAVRRAKAAAVTGLQVRRGRQSTILDGPQSDLLGN